MMDGIAEESVGFLFNLEVQIEGEEDGEDRLGAKGLEARKQQNLSYSAPSESGDAELVGDDGSPEAQARAQANSKNKARQKAKQQRKSRKRNR